MGYSFLVTGLLQSAKTSVTGWGLVMVVVVVVVVVVIVTHSSNAILTWRPSGAMMVPLSAYVKPNCGVISW